MAVAQDTFDQHRGTGYEGQVSTIEVAEIISGQVQGSAIPFGRAVAAGTAPRTAVNVSSTTTADKIIGFSVRSMGVENNPSGNPEYAVGDTASILRRGRMYAKCVGGAAKGAPVHVVIDTTGGDELGQLRGTGDAANTVELNQVKWIEAVADGEIGEIQVDGILHVEIPSGE